MASFPDITNHWARPFIEGLAERGIVSGFPDGTFMPNQATTRAQFAALMAAVFRTSVNRPYVPFVDVPSKHWALGAIQKVYETGYLSGYPRRRFRPEASIARVEALVGLASGLGIDEDNTNVVQALLPNFYEDHTKIPNYAQKMVAAATYGGIVVNYPQVTQLRPNEPATRAEIAAFIYQVLEYGGKMPPVKSPYIPVYKKQTEVSHTRELRGVWLTTIWNKGWPSRRDMSVEEQQQELGIFLDLVQELNLNTVLWQVRPTADALYPTELEPWSNWLTGTQGEAPEPFYDPLEFIINQCHQRGLEFHAWFTPYRAKVSSQKDLVSPHIAITNPEAVYEYGTYLWMDPGAKVVQDRVFEVVMDVVRRYDVDGIHFDDYCYPYGSGSRSPFPDELTYQAYVDSFPPQQEEEEETEEETEEEPEDLEVHNLPSQPLSLEDWRRQNISSTIQRVSQGIKSLKPLVKFGVSPFGIYRSGIPEGIVGLSQYDDIFSDPKQWLAEGWVDYLTPQLYWAIKPPRQSYPVLLQWWTEQNPLGRHIYPGNGLYKYETENWQVTEFEEQVEITRQLAENASLGNIFFDMRVFTRHSEIVEGFKSTIYSNPALPPTMPWLLEGEKPENPARVRGREDKITWWLQEDNPALRGWSVYRQEGDGWQLYKILGYPEREMAANSGVYALCAVDKIGQESEGIVVEVGVSTNRLK